MDGSTPYRGRIGERASPVRALVLVNAGKRRSPNLATGLRRLAEAGVEIADMDLDLSALGQRRTLSAARCCHRIVIGGGDGTLHRAAPLLMQARLPFGILPMGTANDLARTLGVPTDPIAAAEVIANGREQAIDLGDVNGHPYFNVASIGVSVDLARNLTRDVKQRWGIAAYPLTAARVALSSRPFKARVTGDGGTFATESMQIAVGNGRYYGGGLAVDERAAIDDRHLHLYSLEVAGRMEAGPRSRLVSATASRSRRSARCPSTPTAKSSPGRRPSSEFCRARFASLSPMRSGSIEWECVIQRA